MVLSAGAPGARRGNGRETGGGGGGRGAGAGAGGGEVQADQGGWAASREQRVNVSRVVVVKRR